MFVSWLDLGLAGRGSQGALKLWHTRTHWKGVPKQVTVHSLHKASVGKCGRVCEHLCLGLMLWTAVTLCCVVQEAGEYESIISGDLPSGWEDALPTFTPEDKGLATRLHSQTMLNALASAIPGQHALAQSPGNLCCRHIESCIGCLPSASPKDSHSVVN